MTGRWGAWQACSRSSTAAAFSPVDDVAAALEPGTNCLQVLLVLAALLLFYFRFSEFVLATRVPVPSQKKKDYQETGRVVQHIILESITCMKPNKTGSKVYFT